MCVFACASVQFAPPRVSALQKEIRIIDALSHIYPPSRSLSPTPLSLLGLLLPPLVIAPARAHSDTCQEEDMTCHVPPRSTLNYCSFLVSCAWLVLYVRVLICWLRGCACLKDSLTSRKPQHDTAADAHAPNRIIASAVKVFRKKQIKKKTKEHKMSCLIQCKFNVHRK